MKRFTDGIRRAVLQENWYVALAQALTMPDICGGLEGLQSGRARYVDWYDRYLKIYYTIDQMCFLTGDDCYLLRCAYLHQGGEEVAELKGRTILNRIIFGEPAGRFHRTWFLGTANNPEHSLLLNAAQFCEDVCLAVEQWNAGNAGNVVVQAGISRLLSVRDFLSPPYQV